MVLQLTTTTWLSRWPTLILLCSLTVHVTTNDEWNYGGFDYLGREEYGHGFPGGKNRLLGQPVKYVVLVWSHVLRHGEWHDYVLTIIWSLRPHLTRVLSVEVDANTNGAGRSH